MKLTFLVDPLPQLDPGHDSSVAMMEAAQELGHSVWVASMGDLRVRESQAWAKVQPARLQPVALAGDRWQAAPDWFSLGEAAWVSLAEMDAVFVRADPPVTIPYLWATQILDLLATTPTLVLNSPRGLQAANEKLFALRFPSVIPETIVSLDKQVIREFVAAQGKAVLKPLDGKAGEGILFLQADDRNLNSLIEISTRRGREPVMVQQFLPEAKDGDKRVILLDGEPIGAVNRIPTGSEFRGNMAVGGRVAATAVTPRDREIAAALAPELRANGLYFVGIDIIGGYLTEINVTSPTGIREIDRLNDARLGHQVIDWLAAKLRTL